MPRIPRAAFDTNPTSRVDTPNFQAPTDGQDRLMGAATQFAGAMAQLKDQEERTDAFTAANKLKNSYLQQKIQYEEALANTKGDGSFRYVDPTDSNPDVAKRRVIEGKSINDEYNKLKKLYDEGLSSTQSLARPDIASELMNQYVGDDLVTTKIRSNKIIFRKKQSELTESVIQNSDLFFNKLLNDFTTDNANPAATTAKIANVEGSLARELQHASSILGEENTKKVRTYHDNLRKQYASEILKTGVNNSTIAASEALLSKITDNSQRELARFNLEQTKKTYGTVQVQVNFSRAQEAVSKLDKLPAIDGKTMNDVLEIGNKLRNSYIDPRYTDVTKEQIDQTYSELMGKVLAKKVIQDSLFEPTIRIAAEGGSPMVDKDGVVRAPSGNIEDQLRAKVESNIASSPLDSALGDLKKFVVESAVAQAKQGFKSARDAIPDMVDALNPRATPEERIALIRKSATEWKAGEVSLVSKKAALTFQQDFDVNMNQGPDQALMHINQVLSSVGGTEAGPTSNRRAVMMDMIRGKEGMNYLVPLADLDPVRQREVLAAARDFKNNMKVVGIEEKDIRGTLFESISSKVDAELGALPAQLKDGIRDMLAYETAAIAANRSMPIEDAAKEAIKKFNGDFMTLKSENDQNQIILRNADGVDYTQYKKELKVAAEKLPTLPDMSMQDKIDILTRYQTGNMPPEMQAIKAAEFQQMSEDHVNFYLKKIVKVVPSARYANVHELRTINDAPIYKKDGTPVFYDGKAMVEVGRKQIELEESKRFFSYETNTSKQAPTVENKMEGVKKIALAVAETASSATDWVDGQLRENSKKASAEAKQYMQDKGNSYSYSDSIKTTAATLKEMDAGARAVAEDIRQMITSNTDFSSNDRAARAAVSEYMSRNEYMKQIYANDPQMGKQFVELVMKDPLDYKAINNFLVRWSTRTQTGR